MPRIPRWPWAALVAAMLWVALVRVPLVLNAETHLDSDLAVDGLTLIESLQGHWRLHYPGTPHIGTPAVLLSLPQAAIWGANPWTLASGGVVAYELVMLGTFLLACRAFGPSVAAWSLVPLAFASIGTVWLSGRITGGHLLAVAWHAGAFAGAAGLLRRGGVLRALGLGLFCGFGLYVDQMTLYSLVGIVPTLILGGCGESRRPHALGCLAAFAAGCALGFAPHEVAVRVDGYDAYPVTFATIFGDETRGLDWSKTEAMAREHVRLLGLKCLPRLLGGHRLPGFQSDPSPGSLRGLDGRRDPADPNLIPIAATVVGHLAALVGAVALFLTLRPGDDRASAAIRAGLVVSSAAVLAGFVLNRNIYNSDNYRYLVFLLVPLAVGFGRSSVMLARRGGGGVAVAAGLAVAVAVVFTLDTARWYRGFGWIDDRGVPVRRPLDDPMLDWLRDHPKVTRIYGGYWDVYRLAFLTGGRVRGTPYPEYPDRYPRVSNRLPGHRPRLLLARPDGLGRFNRMLALQTGGTLLAEGPGYSIIDWPPRGD